MKLFRWLLAKWRIQQMDLSAFAEQFELANKDAGKEAIEALQHAQTLLKKLVEEAKQNHNTRWIETRGSFIWICEQCNHETPGSHIFCPNCGRKITEYIPYQEEEKA